MLENNFYTRLISLPVFGCIIIRLVNVFPWHVDERCSTYFKGLFDGNPNVLKQYDKIVQLDDAVCKKHPHKCVR